MARKYSPKYSARRDSLSFFVHSADNFYSKAVVRYNEFYGDQFVSEFEDMLKDADKELAELMGS